MEMRRILRGRLTACNSGFCVIGAEGTYNELWFAIGL